MNRTKCPLCGKNIIIPTRAYLNLESYHHGGGVVLAASGCCGYGLLVEMVVSFKVAEYTGDKEQDDWGMELKKTKP